MLFLGYCALGTFFNLGGRDLNALSIFMSHEQIGRLLGIRFFLICKRQDTLRLMHNTHLEGCLF